MKMAEITEPRKDWQRQKTARGFDLVEFHDRNGYECSLQKSSIATEDAIWLGVQGAKVQFMVKGIGWCDYPIPTECSIMPERMHLSREQVAQLLPLLLNFVVHGELHTPDVKPEFCPWCTHESPEKPYTHSSDDCPGYILAETYAAIETLKK